MRTASRCAAVLAFWVVPAADAAEGEARLEVVVRGFHSAAGTLAVALFDNATDFEARTNPIRKAYLTIESGEAHWIVEPLPRGHYAVLAYHDENGNGVIDFRPLGIPKEPFAVSNDAARLLGPPRFENAKFALEHDTRLTLQLH